MLLIRAVKEGLKHLPVSAPEDGSTVVAMCRGEKVSELALFVGRNES
jgi:hypothetical protein